MLLGEKRAQSAHPAGFARMAERRGGDAAFAGQI